MVRIAALVASIAEQDGARVPGVARAKALAAACDLGIKIDADLHAVLVALAD